ncbi:MAG: site-2 protease family protein [Dehalococcoidales bacterium]|nr:site-2 protease family protein [Dehalococcoidales bacterium]
MASSNTPDKPEGNIVQSETPEATAAVVEKEPEPFASPTQAAGKSVPYKGMGMAFNSGKLFGIQFRIHFTWFIIFILVTLSLVNPNYSRWSYWAIGIITSLLFFASVLAHELAHSLVGRANGVPIVSITLFIFGGIAQMSKEAEQPGAELKMAAAGPICSLVIGSVFGLLWWVIPNIAEPVANMILWLALMNVALAVFNLIPGFPLDGGRVFRSIMWHITGSYRLSTQIATRIGQGVGYLIILWGIAIIFLQPSPSNWFHGIWIAFIGGFLVSSASTSYRQLRQPEPPQGANASEMTPPDHM